MSRLGLCLLGLALLHLPGSALALEPVDFGKAFAALEAAYEGYSAALSDASTTSALPPLSPPSGTGAAYAKFLAQLEGTSDAASDELIR